MKKQYTHLLIAMELQAGSRNTAVKHSKRYYITAYAKTRPLSDHSFRILVLVFQQQVYRVLVTDVNESLHLGQVVHGIEAQPALLLS